MDKNTRQDNEIVVIASPENFVSGGPELCHQLCHVLRQNGREAYMYYYNQNGTPTDAVCPKVYEKYNTISIVETNILEKENVNLVIPETALAIYQKYNKCQKYIWWLSVSNYTGVYRSYINPTGQPGYMSYDLDHSTGDFHVDPLDIASDKRTKHLYQSAFAKDFLMRHMKINEKQIYKLSDYLNDEFFGVQILPAFKQDFIAFNPKKGMDKLAPIIKAYPNFKWFPIENMTPKDVGNLLRLSKVYIDLGFHPGKDRIPREAAISGCCVITNRMGAANYADDVPIPNKYKFENPEESVDEIASLIQDILDHYEDRRRDFESYCEMIRGEKQVFFEDVKKIFL